MLMMDRSTYIVLVKHPEDQGRKFGRVTLREELSVDFYEALEQTNYINLM